MIVGVFITLGISINAFFLKGIYSELNAVKIQMATILSNAAHTENEMNRMEEHYEAEIQRLRDRIHTINNHLQKNELRLSRLEDNR